MRVGVVYDPVYLKHVTGEHVENSSRLEKIVIHLKQTGLISQLIPIVPRPATFQEISLVHDPQHFSYIQSLCQTGGGPVDQDTLVSAGSFEAALYAAGGVICAVDAVMENKVDHAFALVRPPGHHATYNRAMGFCLFNNVAIAAKYILSKYGLERLAILDFDVHHGNGTQAAFYEDPSVLYVSVHQHPLYPGTGNLDETGFGPAKGTTINIPLPSGCGDAEYGLAFEQVIMPAVRRFKPQFILVSAGFDSHWMEDISIMQVSVRGFAGNIREIKKLADELCQHRLVLTLEGGYNAESLASSVKATFQALLGQNKIEDPIGPAPRRIQTPDITALLSRIREIHHLR